MKVKALTNFATAVGRRSFIVGRTYDVQPHSAAEYVKAGLAEHVEEPKVETPAAKADPKKVA
jgi:hypothetical protein